ncbi:MAG TPA: hypothetical protein VHO06_13165, partial [Polyangia bacterium]|nr:hypothetical protein [Polyangia bacterium]
MKTREGRRGVWWGAGRARGLGALLAALVLGGAACGSGKATTGAGGQSGNPGGIGSQSGNNGDPPSSSAWTEIAPSGISVQGGTALSAGGQGQDGGTVHLVSQGDTSFDPTMA